MRCCTFLLKPAALSLASAARAIPDRSPLTSAMNTGTPARAKPSASVCRVTVLPVPVAPAMSPWRLAMRNVSATCVWELAPMTKLFCIFIACYGPVLTVGMFKDSRWSRSAARPALLLARRPAHADLHTPEDTHQSRAGQANHHTGSQRSHQQGCPDVTEFTAEPGQRRLEIKRARLTLQQEVAQLI